MKTNAATSAICLTVRLPLNAGIGPPPTLTWWMIVARAGFSWSRFGPTVPVAFAAFSVWQPLQPALAKTALPATGSPARRPARSWSASWLPALSSVGAVVVGAVAERRRRGRCGRLLALLAEDHDGREHRDEEQHADRDVDRHVLAREVRVASRQHERRDEREGDEGAADDRQADLVAGRQAGDDERDRREHPVPEPIGTTRPARRRRTPGGGDTASRRPKRRSLRRPPGRRTRPRHRPSGCRPVRARTPVPGSSRRR